MPAKSKAQQKFMGMVYAAKKGGKPASPEVAKAAKGMSKKSARKFAKTKRKGLPEHVGKKKAKKKTRKENVELELAVILEKILTPDQMVILFEAAEDYEDLWEIYPSLEKDKLPETVDIDFSQFDDEGETAGGKPRRDVGEIINIIMTSLEPGEIDRVIKLLSTLRRYPGVWQKGDTPMAGKHEDIIRIASLVSEDPDTIDEHCGKCGVPAEDTTGTGGVAAGGEAITDDAPMTEASKDGKHKCKLCGEPCGDDGACDTEGCPNNREEGLAGTPMENKKMKGLKLIKESARGRLSRRTHRMLHVASGGRILTEEEWKNKVGEDNVRLAKDIGLLQLVEGKVLNEQPPMVGGDEGPPPFGGEEGAEGGEEELADAEAAEEVEEEVEEEMPITKDELAKFLEALMDRADEEALAMIQKAIASEEEMEGETEEAEEAEETAEELEDEAEEDHQDM